jgi:integrase/recombinase XerD
MGTWLTREQSQGMLDSFDETLAGVRDKAILAVLLSACLRRDECARLTVDQYRKADGRAVLADIRGKHHRIRSVPLPAWAEAAVDRWIEVSGVVSGFLFRRLHKTGRVVESGLCSGGVAWVVERAAARVGVEIAPHDLRRTGAALMVRGMEADGIVDLSRVQRVLGHASVRTTETYLRDVDITVNPACDRMGLR